MDYTYGHFNEDGTEFIITNPETPRAFDNFLWNDVLFSSVHQTGIGFIDYQIDQTEAIQLLTGIGRICDFDVYGRDHLMSRLIYIRDNDTGFYWNVNWEPVKRRYTSFSCTQGLGYSKIQSETEQIFSSFRIFVPKGKDPVELWTISLKNKDSKNRNLSIFIYNQFQFSYKWGFNSYGDMFFRTTYLDSERNAMIANKHPHITPHNHQTAFMLPDRKIDDFDGSRDSFVGLYRCLNEPQAVVNGHCSQSIGSSNATIGAIQFNIHLESGEEQPLNIILGVTDSVDGIEPLKKKYLLSMDRYFEQLKESNKTFIHKNQYITPDEHFNRMLNIWIKQETNYGSQWCRWGWMGYRDIVQHGYGVSSFYPERTKVILQKALQYQYEKGMALRGWNPIDTKPYSDSALWLVYTLISYLKETADFSFLDEVIPFYDQNKGTVLYHIEKALSFLETNKGNHELCLIKFGDWNDSLTGIGAEGKGESVWLSMAYAEALKQMLELFMYQRQTKKINMYADRYDKIKNAINKFAWDGEWYVRCFDDNGRKIGSHENTYGKIFLNTQSWAMIAGIADKKHTDKLIQSANKMLKTDVGYMLLAPTFMEPDPHVGRISYMEPGICENGTVYSHVNIWMILGLLRANRVEEAYEAFKRHAPGYLNGAGDARKQAMPPFLYANGYYGPDHKNNPLQMEFTWITGSVAWFYNVLSKEMIGIQPEYNGLKIEPHIPKAWSYITVKRTFRGRNFDIEITRNNDEETGIWLNDEKLSGNVIPIDKMNDNNIVKVVVNENNEF